MNLILRGTYFLKWEYKIYNGDIQIASLRAKSFFSGSASANYGGSSWEIESKGSSIKNDSKYLIHDLTNSQIVGEVSMDNSKFFLTNLNNFDKNLTSTKINEVVYYFIDKTEDIHINPFQRYAWVNESGQEIISYDFNENILALRMKKSGDKEITAIIPDKTSNEHLSLFFLGICIIRYRVALLKGLYATG